MCGWSGDWDYALKAAFLRAANRRHPVYWTVRGAPSSAARDLISHRGARLIEIDDADTFFTSLRQQVETLAESQQQNPLSVELLVNSAKRYLAKREYRIELNDLFTREVERINAKVSDLAPDANFSPEDFRYRVRTYEGAAEPLARMTGVLGRWRNGTELRLALDFIRMLYAQADKSRSGSAIGLHLRWYPVVMIFSAYGLGLTRAQRWPELHALFSSELDRRYSKARRIVDRLFLQVCEGYERKYWQLLEGPENRITPLSDHLLDVFTGWAKSFAELSPDFELLFDQFELLGSLAYFEQYDKTNLQRKQAQQLQSNQLWMPVGCFAWNKANRERLVKQISSEGLSTSLLDAGFANGRRDCLNMFFKNLDRISDKSSY